MKQVSSTENKTDLLDLGDFYYKHSTKQEHKKGYQYCQHEISDEKTDRIHLNKQSSLIYLLVLVKVFVYAYIKQANISTGKGIPDFE